MNPAQKLTELKLSKSQKQKELDGIESQIEDIEKRIKLTVQDETRLKFGRVFLLHGAYFITKKRPAQQSNYVPEGELFNYRMVDITEAFDARNKP